MWSKFEGKARSLDETAARIKELKWTDWHPKGITLHNTAAPTLKQWAESGPAHDARIRNLESYYENELGWHAGPHFFISRDWINWFSNPLAAGVHSRCWNATRFGIEMVGDFTKEAFDTGDGAKVRDNAVALIAMLNIKFGFKPEDLTFHKECALDNHDCPGHNVNKLAVIARVKAKMAEMYGKGGVEPPPPVETQPASDATRPVLFKTRGKASWFGGPDDDGVEEDEGLALFQSAHEMERHGLAGYLLTSKEAGADGLARRLNPAKHFIACRWNTTDYPLLRDAVAHVRAPKTGVTLTARPVDWGPNSRTGRNVDLSKSLMDDLGIDTDDEVEVTVYKDGK